MSAKIIQFPPKPEAPAWMRYAAAHMAKVLSEPWYWDGADERRQRQALDIVHDLSGQALAKLEPPRGGAA